MSRVFNVLDEKEWDKFEMSHPDGHFFQGLQRIKKRDSMGYKSYIVGIRDNGRVVAGGVLLGRKGEFWMAYGPLIDWADIELVRFFLDGLVAFSHENGLIKVEVFPKLLLSTRDHKGKVIQSSSREGVIKVFKEFGFRYQGETIGYQMKAGRWAFTKDLSGLKTKDELWATYRKTLRARLRQTDGMVTFSELSYDNLDVLVGLIDESDSRNGVSGRELEYYRRMKNAFGDDAKFIVAYRASDQKPIAGAIFIYHNNEVASYLSGMDRAYRDLNGRAWLQDYVMRDCLDRGITKVNFFWIEGRFSNNSLLEFKSGFGGIVEEYVGGFEKIIRPIKYAKASIARKGKSLVRKLLKIPGRLSHRN